MITETDEVGAALGRVQQAAPGHTVNLAELVLLGAERKLQLLESERGEDRRRAALRERFLARTRSREGMDWETLVNVHDRGWMHAADD